jgi:hypothetical protein
MLKTGGPGFCRAFFVWGGRYNQDGRIIDLPGRRIDTDKALIRSELSFRTASSAGGANSFLLVRSHNLIERSLL